MDTLPAESPDLVPSVETPAPSRRMRVLHYLARRSILVVSLVALVTLMGFAGRWNWMLDGFSHFRPLYFLLGCLCSPLLFLLKRYRTVFLAVGALVILINGGSTVRWYFGRRATPPSAKPIRVCLANIRTENNQFGAFLDFVRAVEPDILVVEEVNARWMERLRPLEALLPHVLAQPREDNFGIAIFSRFPFVNSRREYFGTAGVPSLVATLQPGSRAFTVIATHPLPPVSRDYFAHRNAQLNELGAFIRKRSGPVLLLGDLNTTMWSPHYRDFLNAAHLRNARKGFGLLATWPVKFPPPFRVPIDHILHNSHFTALDCRTAHVPGSDHLALLAKFGFSRPGSASDNTH